MPLTQTPVNWVINNKNNRIEERGSAGKVPSTVRATDMQIYQQRCGTAMIQKTPLEYDKFAVNQSLDLESNKNNGKTDIFTKGF